MDNELPKHARVVVIGAGIVGSSVAYHLAKLGWTDIAVLERDTYASGTTGHGAGLVTQLRHTRSLTEISRYGVELYPNLQKETGQPSGYRRTGSITVARCPDRLEELKRNNSMARIFGVEIEEISLARAAELLPLLHTDDLAGAIHIPGDGQTVPVLTTRALLSVAQDNGVSFFERARVIEIIQQAGAVSGVRTVGGDITCEVIVNCAGMWASELARSCGVIVPLHAADHAYLVTAPVKGVDVDMPSLRDPDGHIYLRRDIEDSGGLLIGGFEPVAQPWGMDGIDDDFAQRMWSRDWSRYENFWESALERIPVLANVIVLKRLVGPESFTPDNNYILGEAPTLKGFFVAAGFNSSGIASAAGAGRAIAEWIVEGHPTMDLTEVDIKRFHPHQNAPRYLHDRTVERVGTLYSMHWPHLQPKSARGIRLSPIHDKLASMGACFGVVAGWERPNWYAPQGIPPTYKYSYGRQNWFDYSAGEHKAVRDSVGLFDQTSFGKFLLHGPDVERVAQHIFANDVAIPVGRVMYTAMLNERGGIEGDVTVTRTAEDAYLVVTGAASANRDFAWISRHIPVSSAAYLTDVTSAYAVFGVMGPRSRELLSSLTDTDLMSNSFPFMWSKEIAIGYALLRATRITYVGELGWELYVPTEFAAHVFERIVSNGDRPGLRLAGFHAMESLRMEKAYRAWGHDIVNMDTPLEAGLGFAVAFDKGVEFLGRKALTRQLGRGVTKRMVSFTLADPNPLMLGNEPVYRNGALVGYITSASFGHTLGRSVGMGYVVCEDGVSADYILSGAYEVEIANTMFAATAYVKAPYDPTGARVRT